MGTLFIRSMPVQCVIGVHPFERVSRQQLLISLMLELDFADAAASDDIDQAMDYTELAARIETIAREGRFRLIETLAETIADDLFDTSMQRLEIEVQKPRALTGTPHVGVRVTRETSS